MDTDSGGNAVDEYTVRIASILRRNYETSGLSLTDIANETGLARSTVYRVLNGQRPITTWYLRQICEVLGIKPSQVLDEAAEA